MKGIKINYLSQLQKKSVQVLFVSPDDDSVHDIYLKLDNIDMFRACYDSLLALGFYGISFWVKGSSGKYSLKVVK